MHRTATRFGLIVTVALLAAAVKRVVDGIMQPYLAQGQRRPPVASYGGDLLIWERSSRFHCTAIATSSHMEKLPTRVLRSRPKP